MSSTNATDSTTTTTTTINISISSSSSRRLLYVTVSVVVRRLGVVGVDVDALTVEFSDDVHDVVFDFGRNPMIEMGNV